MGQFCQRGGMIADLVSDFRAGVADIPLAEEFVKPAVLDEFGGFDQTQRKGVHAQDIAVEHILIGAGGAAVLGVKMKTDVDADPAHGLLDPPGTVPDDQIIFVHKVTVKRCGGIPAVFGDLPDGDSVNRPGLRQCMEGLDEDVPRCLALHVCLLCFVQPKDGAYSTGKSSGQVKKGHAPLCGKGRMAGEGKGKGEIS